MKWRFRTVFILVLIHFMFLSCEHSNPVVENHQDHSLVPTAVGNFWIYADSVIINDSLQVSIDTTMVVGFAFAGGRKWWQLSNNSIATAILSSEFLVQSDSIYTWETCRGGSRRLGLKFIPPQDTTVTFNRLLGCDTRVRVTVKLIEKQYQTPAGKFDSYVLHDLFLGTEKDVFSIVPGVGIINRTQEGEITGRGKFLIKSTLIDYSLE